MQRSRGILAAIAIAATLSAFSSPSMIGAQSALQSIDKPIIPPKWTGVWQAHLDGVPSVTLTLADDAGESNGTIVFHAIKNDHGHPYSFSTEPHTLIHPHIDGNAFTFQVVRGNGSKEVLNMEVEFKQDGNLHFACTNCGLEGTKAEMVRMN
jgi:hypothetical protein